MHFIIHGNTGQLYCLRARRVFDDDDDGVTQTWQPQPCRLGSHHLNNIRYLCQLPALKTEKALTIVTWSYRGFRCSLSGCFLGNGVAQDGAERKYTGQPGPTCLCSLHI